MQHDFLDDIKKAGMPTTEEDLVREIKQISTQNGLDIINPSEYSPFWRITKNLFIIPVLQMVHFVGKTFMPNCYLKTAKGKYLDLLAFTYNISRKPATFANGSIQFTKADPMSSVDIPLGTIIRTPLINGKIYRVKTTQAITIPPEQASAFIPVIALEAGYASNLGQGYYCIIEDPINGVSVKNLADWIVSPGADEEDDEALRLRVRNIFIAVSQWHTNAKYKAMISERSGLDIDRIFFNHSTSRGAGSADIYILFDVADDSKTFLDNVQKYIIDEGNHGHGDSIQVKALPALNVSLPLSVRFKNNISADTKSNTIEKLQDFIKCAFRENNAFAADLLTKTYPFQTFSLSRLFSEAHKICPEIESIRTTADDPRPNLEIPRLLSLTITEVQA